MTALASGAFIGAVLGFIGAGGAMVSVPIFLYLFDFTPIHATTAALAVVFLAAAAGLGPKFKSKRGSNNLGTWLSDKYWLWLSNY